MKIGDLVKVSECVDDPYMQDSTVCDCFFCAGKSNRIGLVVSVAPRDAWHVMFDTGMWRLDTVDLDRGDVEVIRESR